MGDISKIVCVLFLYALNRFYLKNVVVIPAISYILKCHFNDFLGGIFIIAYINLILEHSKYRHYRVDGFDGSHNNANMRNILGVRCAFLLASRS